jgi:hypothetical protein
MDLEQGVDTACVGEGVRFNRQCTVLFQRLTLR